MLSELCGALESVRGLQTRGKQIRGLGCVNGAVGSASRQRLLGIGQVDDEACVAHRQSSPACAAQAAEQPQSRPHCRQSSAWGNWPVCVHSRQKLAALLARARPCLRIAPFPAAPRAQLMRHKLCAPKGMSTRGCTGQGRHMMKVCLACKASPAHELLADDARDAALLQDLAAHIQRQVAAIHHTLDEVQVAAAAG